MLERDYNLIKKLIEIVKENKIEWDFKSDLCATFNELRFGISIHMLKFYNDSPCDGGHIEYIVPTLSIYEIKKSPDTDRYYYDRSILKITGDKMPPDYDPLKIEFEDDEVSISHLYKLAYAIYEKCNQKIVNETIEKIMNI